MTVHSGKPEMVNDGVLDAEAAGRLLGAHPETIRRMARRGAIPAYKIGKDWRFQKDALLHWVGTHHLRARHPKVLIVDDQARVRNVMREMLEAHHYTVLLAPDGTTALAMIEKERPDAVLLDLKLPGMDGPTVLGEIRKRYDALPVIIITAYPDSALMERALKFAPFMMLPKPVGRKELLETVRLALGNGPSLGTLTEEAGKDQTDFKAFFENSPEYCYMISPDGIILDVSPAALAVLGYRKEEIVGKPLKMVYAPECVPRIKELFSKWRREQHLTNEEMVIISKTGERRTVLLSASAVKDENGEILHSVSIQRDISDLKLGDAKGDDAAHRVSKRHPRIGAQHD